MSPFWQTIAALVAGIVAIVVLTGRWKIPAFFALLLASLLSAAVLTIPPTETIGLIQKGFGQTMSSLAWLVALGTLLGLVLQASGAIQQMASFLLRFLGHKRSDRAMAGTGFLIGMPVFCDAGFVVLQGLPPVLAKKSGMPAPLISLSLACGLFVIHCLIPPHPGAAAAAISFGANTGKLIGLGILVALPALWLTQQWLRFRYRNEWSVMPAEDHSKMSEATTISWTCFLPVLLPVILIGLRSLLQPYSAGWPAGLKHVLALGEPVAALLIAVLAAVLQWKNRNQKDLVELLEKTVVQAGPILLVTGAGGSFGAILASAGLGEQLADFHELNSLGLLVPFIICALLKTAQGSSTVAMLTAASIVLPLLPQLGLESENGRILATLSLGAGSMMLSHANDSYFWVISRFAGIPPGTMLRQFTPASFLLAVTSLIFILLASVWLL